MSFKSTDKFLFLGRSGSGKSYLARKVTESYPRRVIFDTLSEYTEDDGDVCNSFEEFGKKILETQNSDKFTIIYKFDIESADQTEEFSHALRILYYRGNCLILVEEIQNFSNPRSLPHWLRQCLFTGRHRNLALAFTTQRPGECHKSIVSQCSHVFFGALHEKNDLDYCAVVLGKKSDLLASLPEREFLYFQPGGTELKHLKSDGSMQAIASQEKA